MAFLRNKTVNLLNLHYGLLSLAMSGGGVFYAVFMLKAGVPVPAVLVTFALILMGRFCFRPIVLIIGKRVGLKPLVIVGTIGLAIQYPILARVHGVDPTLLLLIVVAAVGDTFYWTAFHAWFAQEGDAEHRGHQTSAREALASVVGIVAPIAGGWTLANFGPQAAFGAAAVVNLLAAAPLFGADNVPVAREPKGAFRASLAGAAIFVADGWAAAGFNVIWQIVLFMQLSQSFTAFGGAMALAALTGAVAGLLLGRHIDAGGGPKAVWVALAVAAVTLLARAGATTPAMAVLANALGALAGCVYVPTMMTAVYNLAKRSPCPLRFHLVAEGGWDLGCTAACLTAAGLAAMGIPLQVAILLCLGGAVAVAALLRRYYAGIGVEAQAAAV